LIGSCFSGAFSLRLATASEKTTAAYTESDSDLFSHIRQVNGKFEMAEYRRLLGAANEFKEGDQAIGVAAEDNEARLRARSMLAQTRIGQFDAHPVFEDELYRLLIHTRDPQAIELSENLTFSQVKERILNDDE